ncbi:MAG TPA: DUF3108 domain-containing protein [Steroidobacteraceae bacterium]|nr:DUF3108 domain-containing protein [Steroidobacteraceae bacterium]
MAVGALALLATAPAVADGALTPFVAEYDVRYGRMAVGTSRTELARADDHWVIETTSTASGFARVIASGTLRQRSEFELTADGVRPRSYTFDDGTQRTGRDISLAFDWGASRVHGTAEDAAVDLATVENLQDAASMQALVIARLRAGREPGTVAMIEKDKVKYYRYALVRRETLATAMGDVETVVYRSSRDGSDRETLTWHAPKLGFAAVQAEQRIGGKRGFQTYIRSFKEGTF